MSEMGFYVAFYFPWMLKKKNPLSSRMKETFALTEGQRSAAAAALRKHQRLTRLVKNSPDVVTRHQSRQSGIKPHISEVICKLKDHKLLKSSSFVLTCTNFPGIPGYSLRIH